MGEGNYQQDRKKQRHLFVLQDEEGCRYFVLEASSYFLGRDPKSSIVVKSRAVSRQHAILLRITGSNPNEYNFILIDGNLQGDRSKNGTRVNGEACVSHRLNSGDKINLGTHVVAKYILLSPLTDAEFQSYCQTCDLKELIEDDGVNTQAKETLIIDSPMLEREGDVSLYRLASFPEIIPCPMLEVTLKGQLTYLNPAALKAFPELPILGLDHPALAGLLASVQQPPRKVSTREVQVNRQVYEQSIHFIPENGLVRCCLFDITPRKAAEAELRRRDYLSKSVAEATTHLLASFGYDQAIINALETFGKAAGIDRLIISQNHGRNEALANTVRYEWTQPHIAAVRERPHRQNQLYSQSYLHRWESILRQDQLISESVRSLPPLEKQVLQQDGIQSILVVPINVNHEFWGYLELDCCATDYQWSEHDGSIVRALAASFSATLQRQEQDEVIKRQAFHDALTGLPNRVLFGERLEQALMDAAHGQHQVAVMFLDLDRFKVINDTLGHSVGDGLLQEVANRLRLCVRESDTVARWGGDEFTILLPKIHFLDDAVQTATRILDSFRDVCCIEDHELYINTSIGIATYPSDAMNAEDLVSNADIALYQSKEGGRGTYQVYNASMNSEATETFALQNNLRLALERNEFVLHYQPKVNVYTNRIVGMEALIRWNHPEQGLVPPNRFIPLAEEAGLIQEMGEWALRTACEQTVRWHAMGMGHLSIAVNLSARQFHQPTLIGMITDILAETGLPAHALDLEITETTAIENIAFTKAVLLHLQDLGVRISLDDFGTGYSSLNHLAQIPLNTIKIDRAFVKNLHQSTKDMGIVNAVVSLGHCLGLDVVAEGVEDAQTFELLRSLKCELIQGYLISPPLPVEEATVCLLENGLPSQKTSIPTPEFQEDQQAQLLASSTVNDLQELSIRNTFNDLQELSVHDPFNDVQDIQDFVVGDPMTR